jgi:hypothetical protein
MGRTPFIAVVAALVFATTAFASDSAVWKTVKRGSATGENPTVYVSALEIRKFKQIAITVTAAPSAPVDIYADLICNNRSYTSASNQKTFSSVSTPFRAVLRLPMSRPVTCYASVDATYTLNFEADPFVTPSGTITASVQKRIR